MPTEVVVLEGARTPFGTFGGVLKDVTPTDLAVIAAKEALRRSGVEPAMIDNVFLGLVIPWGGAGAYFARHAALKAGVPECVPALTLNRLCGSGLQAVVSAAQALLTGDATFALAGGAENMSLAPFVVKGARWGVGLGEGKLDDVLWDTLTDAYNNTPMAITAENLAERYAITRQEQDEFAYRSQMACKQAIERGLLREEIAPVPVKERHGNVVRMERDEHPRPAVTMQDLERLKARFKEGGTVTPGNASGINDGAAALVLTTAENAR